MMDLMPAQKILESARERLSDLALKLDEEEAWNNLQSLDEEIRMLNRERITIAIDFTRLNAYEKIIGRVVSSHPWLIDGHQVTKPYVESKATEMMTVIMALKMTITEFARLDEEYFDGVLSANRVNRPDGAGTPRQ